MRHRKLSLLPGIKLLLVLVFFSALALFLFAFPRPVYAAACASGMTYGDAPSSYGQSCESVVAGLRLGATVPVGNPFTYPCATGLANCNTHDDFLNPLTPIDLTKSQYTWTVPLYEHDWSDGVPSGLDRFQRQWELYH